MKNEKNRPATVPAGSQRQPRNELEVEFPAQRKRNRWPVPGIFARAAPGLTETGVPRPLCGAFADSTGCQAERIHD